MILIMHLSYLIGKNGEIILQAEKTKQNRFKLSLNEINKKSPAKKSNEQKSALYNIKML